MGLAPATIVLVGLASGFNILLVVVICIRCYIAHKRRQKLYEQPFPFPGDVECQVERKDMSSVGKTMESSTTVVKEYRGKENGVGAYLNKVLAVLFMVFGLLTIILSVVLDNSYNDNPVRFIPFAILAPFTFFFGFLASGCFQRVPLRLIAFLKRHGFLRNVVPCSPWHDNVVTDFSGMICTLEQSDSDVSHLPQVLHTFLYGGQGTVITQSTSALGRTSSFREFSSLKAHLQDISVQDSVLDISATSHSYDPTVMTTGKVPSQAVAQIDQSPRFQVSDHGHFLAFRGPTISGFPLEVQVRKNKSIRDTFKVCCLFRNKITRRMYLNSQRLHNLAENMVRWVEIPHPIVVDEFSDILHCMPLQDILWEFTETFYTLKAVQMQHRFLGCLCDERMEQIALIALVATTSLSGLIPLLSETRSLYYLFLAAPIVAYVCIVVARRLNAYYIINHCLKLLLCPLFTRFFGFTKLYKWKSSFIWCNEFRKERVVNPQRFLIDQVTANCLLEDGETCFDEDGSVGLPDDPGPERTSPITLECQNSSHKLVMAFDCVRAGSYIDLKLSFYENGDLLDSRTFIKIPTEVEKVQLVERLFSYYSEPTFGGYVETIRPCCWSYLGHCPRFLDICKKIIDGPTPIILVAKRKPDSRLVIGDSSLSVKAK